MRVLCAAIGATLFASVAAASELKEGADWRNCSEDKQCVMIDGLCDKTSVNWQAREKAIAYYNERRKTARCVDRFWRPKELTFRCSELTKSCETIAVQAASKDK